LSTWEERMSQRAGGMNAGERSRTAWGDQVRRWDEEHAQAKLANGFVLAGGTGVAWNGGTRIIGGKWFKPEPAEGPDYCRECCTWDTEEGIYKVTCFETYMGMRCKLGHDHHDGEVWMA
jgi:hypothetical protein